VAERDGVLCFEQWPGANRFHVRRPGEPKPREFFCGLYTAGEGAIRFEDELNEVDMCKTCRSRALKHAEEESRQ
jgi:hypothetical protein